MRRMGKVFGGLLLGAVVTGMTVWGMGALYYAPLPPRLRGPLALTYGLATAGAFLVLPYRRRTLLGFVLVWGALGLWWSTIPASHSRDWQTAVAVLPMRPWMVTVSPYTISTASRTVSAPPKIRSVRR